MRRTVMMNWGISSYFGWGVYGLNLALAWADDPEVALVPTSRLNPAEIAVDPVRARRLSEVFAEAAKAEAQLDAFRGRECTVDSPMLGVLSHDFRLRPLRHDIRLAGTPTIGVTFFESAQMTPEAIDAASRYPLIVTGSHWNEQVLRAHGVTRVRTILQGVDPSLFHPVPPVSWRGERFFVFSGGKLEPRKGQDIVMAAFRRFAERRPEATLVAAWHSPFSDLAGALDGSGLAAPMAFDAEGRPDPAGWAAANGLRPEQFIDAGQTPNALMPPLLQQMDVGLFPNRCEGGTNLVAMECMACGVPAILSANTGHLDLIEADNCFVLERQGKLAGEPHTAPFGDTPGWGESDVDEAVERLEQAYGDREAARRRGERGAASLGRLTWARTAQALKAAIFETAAG